MIESRWHQEEAIQSFFDYFKTARGNPLIALPTGTGKSVVIALLIMRILQMWPNQRFIVATHVKELIEQNAGRLQSIWPLAPMGIHSAGLNQRDTAQPVIFAGIASMKSRVSHFGHRDLFIIDECHLLSQDEKSTYRKVINELLLINPAMKVVGLTATPYRMGQGRLVDDGIFTDICYDLTDQAGFARLIADGFLCPLIARPTFNKIDQDKIRIIGGEFSSTDNENELEKILEPAVNEAIYYGQDRKQWLFFSSGVQSAEHITELLLSKGIDAACVHSKRKSKHNDDAIKAYKAGELRTLVNFGKLTTGFDHPPADLLAMFRCTNSPGLWVQILGRLTRPFPGKLNGLVLDYAGNAERLGPINNPRLPRKKGEKGGTCPVKICDKCGIYNATTAKYCGGVPYASPEGCGHEFTFLVKINNTASTAKVLELDDMPVTEWISVEHVLYSRHVKNDNTSLKVSYINGIKEYAEWVHLEGKGLMLHSAKQWWYMRASTEPPESVNIAILQTETLKKPKRIKVWMNHKNTNGKTYPKVINYEF